jgi:hypothetical protein
MTILIGFDQSYYRNFKMFQELLENVAVQAVTKLKRNMKQRLMLFGDRLPAAKTCCC